MKTKKNIVNTWCYILAAVIAVATPCYRAIAAPETTPTKRSDSVILSTGDVKYTNDEGQTVTLFAVQDLYYLENRIVDVLNVKVKELQTISQ